MKIDLKPEDSEILSRFAMDGELHPQLLGILGGIIGTDSPISKRLDEVWAELEAEDIAATGRKNYPRTPTEIDEVTTDHSGFYIDASDYRWHGDTNCVSDVFISFADFLDPDFIKKKAEAREMEEEATKERSRVKRLEAKTRKAARVIEKARQAEIDERAEYKRLAIKYAALT